MVPRLAANELPNAIYLEYERLYKAALYAQDLGLKTNLGHGLTLVNLAPILHIPNIAELHIGHSIIANALYYGLQKVVRRYLDLMLSNS